MNRIWLVIALISLGAATGVALVTFAPKAEQVQTMEWLDRPRSLEKFQLASEQGRFNHQSLIGHWTIVSFGYLQCPDICPTNMMELAALAERFTELSIETQVKFVFVSVDTARDTVSDVGRFVRYFNANFIGVTGSEGELRKFTRRLGVSFKIYPDKDNYQVAHSMFFSVIDPKGYLRARFRPEFDVAKVTKAMLVAVE